MVGHDSAARNAVLGLRARGVPTAVQRRLVMPSLRTFGLEHRASTKAASLSGGERQRLAIARAVIGRPAIVLADEPTGSLDSSNGQIVLQHLRDLHSQGVTVVMVTHDPEIARSADRIITMKDGAVVDDLHTATSLVEDKTSPERPQLSRAELNRRWTSEWADLLADALTGLTTKPFKALLLTLAFLLGSGGLVASIGLSESASTKVGSRIDAAGEDEVRWSRSSGFSSWRAIQDDLQKARDLQGVVRTGAVLELAVNDLKPTLLDPVTHPDAPQFSGSIRVADSGYLATQGATTRGGDPALLDMPLDNPIAFLGADAAKQLGVGRAGPGAMVWVAGQAIPVAGIIERSGRDVTLDSAIILGAGSYAISPRSPVTLVAQTSAGAPASIAEALPKALEPTDQNVVKVQTVADLRELKHGVNADLGRLIGMVSMVLLLMACLSAGTTMYLGALARSKEIALRRALGMRRTSIASMFLAEGAIVGLIGGAAGSVLGMLTVLAYASAEGWSPALPWYLAPLGIGIGLVSGVLSAGYPAWRASKSLPAQLIRSGE